ncbi:MAG: aminodeoxychorismate synthase component I [Acidimicrobiales bacterium]|nr:MAG: aminodeoxychorismate synthase component I [Acidimicrobiales bacterium]
MVTLVEVARWEWQLQDGGDPAQLLQDFVISQGFSAQQLVLLGKGYNAALGGKRCHRRAALLFSAAGAAVMAAARLGYAARQTATSNPASFNPTPQLPDVAVVVYDAAPARSGTAVVGKPRGGYRIGAWKSSWSSTEYKRAIEHVRSAIADGQVYQANVVGHLSASYEGDPSAGLRAVSELPGARFGQLLSGHGWAVAMGSPELLVRATNGVVTTKPIKGTRPRTATGRRELATSAKEHAEHIMIVDMARNDVAQIATVGSVVVRELFVAQPWCDLWQAESTVEAELRPDVGIADLLSALCPAASVTGAPKLAALRLLNELEPVGRGPSMGAIGWLTSTKLELGVSIRTLAAVDGRFHLWAGGGITWGSDPAEEVAEAEAKSLPIRRICTLLGGNGVH